MGSVKVKDQRETPVPNLPQGAQTLTDGSPRSPGRSFRPLFLLPFRSSHCSARFSSFLTPASSLFSPSPQACLCPPPVIFFPKS